jgi:hypothetical protein
LRRRNATARTWRDYGYDLQQFIERIPFDFLPELIDNSLSQKRTATESRSTRCLPDPSEIEQTTK